MIVGKKDGHGDAGGVAGDQVDLSDKHVGFRVRRTASVAACSVLLRSGTGPPLVSLIAQFVAAATVAVRLRISTSKSRPAPAPRAVGAREEASAAPTAQHLPRDRAAEQVLS